MNGQIYDLNKRKRDEAYAWIMDVIRRHHYSSSPIDLHYHRNSGENEDYIEGIVLDSQMGIPLYCVYSYKEERLSINLIKNFYRIKKIYPMFIERLLDNGVKMYGFLREEF